MPRGADERVSGNTLVFLVTRPPRAFHPLKLLFSMQHTLAPVLQSLRALANERSSGGRDERNEQMAVMASVAAVLEFRRWGSRLTTVQTAAVQLRRTARDRGEPGRPEAGAGGRRTSEEGLHRRGWQAVDTEPEWEHSRSHGA